MGRSPFNESAKISEGAPFSFPRSSWLHQIIFPPFSVAVLKVTTDSRHSLPVAENLLDQKFEASAPSQIWMSDITYIPTGEGWLYLAGHKDLFTGEVVGYAMAERMTKNLISQSLLRAIATKRPAAGLIHHSDRGSQYCALFFDAQYHDAQYPLTSKNSPSIPHRQETIPD
jgi:hypothetical protein